MKQIIENLLKIKSLFSLTAMFLLIYGTITKILTTEFTASIIGLIVGFYFKKSEGE